MDLEDGGESPWGDVPSRSNPQTQSPEDNASAVAGNGSDGQAPAVAAAAAAAAAADTLSPGPKSSTGRGPRTPRKHGAHKTQLQAVDDSLGPLGPLGDNFEASMTLEAEQPPAPPYKESPAGAGLRDRPSPPQTSASRGALDPADVEDDDDDAYASARPRTAPSSHKTAAAASPQPQRQTRPSVPIEQAAKPKFDIAVGDPHKVGDLTSSHIVYQVRTKTTSKAYKESEFAVSRRYRDFLWLYNQLHNNSPGVVVPPPPEKQAVGRFDANFVESRRAALERMLNRVAAHPILQHDGDLKIFLESEAFSLDVKHKEKKDPGFGESKGMFSSIGISASSSTKFIEQDDWFHERRIYLDGLENQLKALLKTVDMVVKQRKELAEAAGDFSMSLHSLSTVELSPSLSGPLAGLSDLQLRIREVYERQAQQDVLTLGITVDEYIRLIGSVKQAFSQRQKAFNVWRSAENELQKRRAVQDKTLRQGRTQQDRLNQLSADVADAERRVNQSRLLFEDMGRLMKAELDRFEKEKVEDFKSGLETFLESAVEAQKELIELWETYLVQLDADGDVQPFYSALGAVPAAAAAVGAGAGGGGGGHMSSPHSSTAQAHHQHHHHHQEEHDHDRAQQDLLSETDAQSAATLTAEQED